MTQCGRCGGKGGPHTCLRDLNPGNYPALPNRATEGMTYWRDPQVADELEAANEKLDGIRAILIDNKPAPLYRILQILDGE